MLRSLFGAAFPLFTTQMYDNLGIHWASSVPGFLSLACVPMPFLFYKYGPAIRARCKFAAEAEAFMRRMKAQYDEHESDTEVDDAAAEKEKEKETELATGTATGQPREEVERQDAEQEAIDYSFEAEQGDGPRFERIRTTQSRPRGARRATSYDGNPFHLDRVNTRESFRSGGKNGAKVSRTSSKASRR